MKKSNILWGSFFVLAAVLVVLDKTGILAGISLIKILISILLISVIVKSVSAVNFWGICFPTAMIAILYDEELHIQSFTPWTVLIAALFLSIGLTLLFPHNKQ